MHQLVNNGLIHLKVQWFLSGAMGVHRSERMANITATLPIPLLERMDELVRDGRVPSRSHVLREAVRKYMKTIE